MPREIMGNLRISKMTYLGFGNWLGDILEESKEAGVHSRWVLPESGNNSMTGYINKSLYGG